MLTNLLQITLWSSSAGGSRDRMKLHYFSGKSSNGPCNPTTMPETTPTNSLQIRALMRRTSIKLSQLSKHNLHER